MITLSELLRDYDPAGGRPVPRAKIYAANLISRDEAERIRLQQQRDEYAARKRFREEIAADVARMVAQADDAERCASGVPERASQLAARANVPPLADGGIL